MIVRIKKRGELPIHGPGRIGVIPVLNNFKGCCIEVQPSERKGRFFCDGKIYRITDSRFADLQERGRLIGSTPAICEHALIDDIDTLDSDFCDEQAQEGDLAFVQIPATVQR
jgi:hypothetical protein